MHLYGCSVCLRVGLGEVRDKRLRLWVVIAGDLGSAQCILPLSYYRHPKTIQLHLQGYEQYTNNCNSNTLQRMILQYVVDYHHK